MVTIEGANDLRPESSARVQKGPGSVLDRMSLRFHHNRWRNIHSSYSTHADVDLHSQRKGSRLCANPNLCLLLNGFLIISSSRDFGQHLLLFRREKQSLQIHDSLRLWSSRSLLWRCFLSLISLFLITIDLNIISSSQYSTSSSTPGYSPSNCQSFASQSSFGPPHATRLKMFIKKDCVPFILFGRAIKLAWSLCFPGGLKQ